MKILVAIAILTVGVARASYYPAFYPGYNPYAALSALGLYHPWIAPPVAPPVPYSGTYSYHDGHRPTVVQANNDGYAFPHVAAKSAYSWDPWTHHGHSAAAAATWGVPAAAIATHVHAPAAAAVATTQAVAVHPANPYQKTVVQANLGGVDPWKYASFYGTGIYGHGWNNYIPAPAKYWYGGHY
ncbi:uncharacterized protein LOC129745014 [Uranotaenia lowii]|uniref:uncharacterized protein LOC129745014 n=1 Tax=Uranotaenia lowii TaxID=190385 RepID=UPI00247A5ECA|nr:uncharacterized protein LOC129745014 [Uranotaenia lowii]